MLQLQSQFLLPPVAILACECDLHSSCSTHTINCVPSPVHLRPWQRGPLSWVQKIPKDTKVLCAYLGDTSTSLGLGGLHSELVAVRSIRQGRLL